MDSAKVCNENQPERNSDIQVHDSVDAERAEASSEPWDIHESFESLRVALESSGFLEPDGRDSEVFIRAVESVELLSRIADIMLDGYKKEIPEDVVLRKIFDAFVEDEFIDNPQSEEGDDEWNQDAECEDPQQAILGAYRRLFRDNLIVQAGVPEAEAEKRRNEFERSACS